MKRIIYKLTSFLLCAALTVSLFGCDNSANNPTEPTEPTEPPLQLVEPTLKDGVYQITEAGHMLFLQQNPNKNYALCNDIDMGGYVWTPVDEFSGVLDGLINTQYYYTVSNIVIPVAAGDTNVGLFRVLSGSVKNIIFSDITVSCTEAFTGNIGIVAGTSNKALVEVSVLNCSMAVSVKDANVGMVVGKQEGKLEQVITSGSLQVTMAGGTNHIGGAVGLCEGNATNITAKNEVTVTGTDATGAVGGALGNQKGTAKSITYSGHFKVTAGTGVSAASLVGKLESGELSNSYNCARTSQLTGVTSENAYCGSKNASASVSGCHTRDNANIEDTLSDAERALRQKAVDHMYALCTVRWSPVKDVVINSSSGNKTFKAGQVYHGLPYDNNQASLEKFMSHLRADGTIDTSVYEDWGRLLGSDCADTVYWAWAQVASDIEFTLTDNIIGSAGILPVGNYTGFTKGNSTNAINNSNGAQAMCEAFAKVQMGDALLYGPNGHIRMAAEAAYVFRKADGKIDASKSYIVCHEQGSGSFGVLNSTCAVNRKFTFSQLFGSYIPITISAYTQESSRQHSVSVSSSISFNSAGAGKGTISCQGRFKYVRVDVMDGNNVVFSQTVYPYYTNNTSGYPFQEGKPFDMVWFQLNKANMTAGKTYTCKITANVGDTELPVTTVDYTA